MPEGLTLGWGLTDAGAWGPKRSRREDGLGGMIIYFIAATTGSDAASCRSRGARRLLI